MKIHLFNLPSVDQYVNQLISSYITIQTDFNQGDILLADKINHLKQKSRYMIKNIDSFMSRNALDPRVGYLYSTRNKLSKFLFKIEENVLVKNLNEVNQKQGVRRQQQQQQNVQLRQQTIYQTPVSRKSPQQQQLSFHELHNNRSGSSKPYNNESAVIIQSYGQNEQDQMNDQLLERQFSQVKQFAVNSQQKRKTDQLSNKQGYFRNSKDNLGNNRVEGKVGNHKKHISEIYQPRQKSRTPTKTTTSRKTQLFNPRQNVASKYQQQLFNDSVQVKEGFTKRYQPDKKSQKIIPPQQQKPVTKNSSNYSQRSKLPLDQVIQKTPSKSRVGATTSNSSNIKNNYQSFGNSNNNIQNIIEKDVKSPVQFTPVKQQQRGGSNAPSSAMRSLANLIFTIKMTKEEYNQFKRIKEQHQGAKHTYIQ